MISTPYVNNRVSFNIAYVNGLNAAEEKLGSAFQSSDVNEEIAIQSAIKFNGGGMDISIRNTVLQPWSKLPMFINSFLF